MNHGLVSSGFVTVALMHGAAPAWPPPFFSSLAPIVLVQREPAPKPRQLVGWKEILACSALHGGPGSRRHLFAVAHGDPDCPIYQPDKGGSVTALDVELARWISTRRKPLGWRRLAEKKKPEKHPAKPGRRARA